MDLQASKIELAKLILSIDNPEVISKMLDFLKAKEKDFWYDLSTEQQNDIKKAMAELDRGEKISWNEFKPKTA